MGIYLWYLVTFFTLAFFLMRTLEGEKRILAMALTASVTGMLADNLLNVSLHFAVPGFLYWWFAGILASLGRGNGTPVRLENGLRRAGGVAAVVFAGLLIVFYVNHLKAEIHYFNGFKFAKRNDIRQAIQELEAAHRLQRFEVNNNYELANSYARTRDTDRALFYYEESLRANAGYDEIYFNMATVLAQKGDFTRSLREYTRALYINPLSQEAYSVMSSIMLQDMPRYRGALVPLLEQATLLFPDNKDMWNNLGYVRASTGKKEAAVDAYKKALAIDPSFVMARRNLESLLGRTFAVQAVKAEEPLLKNVERAIAAEQWEKARVLMEQLLKENPSDPALRLYMGNIYFKLGKLEPAVAQYDLALGANSKNSAALGNRGLAYFALRRFNEARHDFARLLEIEPSNAEARNRLAIIDQEMRRQK